MKSESDVFDIERNHAEIMHNFAVIRYLRADYPISSTMKLCIISSLFPTLPRNNRVILFPDTTSITSKSEPIVNAK